MKKLILHKRLWAQSLLGVLVFSEQQALLARRRLGFTEDQIRITANWTDQRFYRPDWEQDRRQGPVVAIGGEHRDYPTLIEACRDLQVETSMGSAWARVTNTARSLPANVTNKRRDWHELRALYQQALAVVVPLVPCDFSAGITSIIEGMACAAPLVVTRTEGLQGVLPRDSVLWVEPGDTVGMRRAIERIRNDPELARALGRRGRDYVERIANIDHWAEQVREWIEPWRRETSEMHRRLVQVGT